MSGIGNVGNNVNLNLPVKVDNKPVIKEEVKCGQDCQDHVSLGQTVGKAALGTAFAVVAAPFNAMKQAVKGSTNSALRSLDLEGKQKGISKNLQKLAVESGTIVGAVMSAGMGPAGMVAGALMGPGVMGGLIAGGKGAIEGGKIGYQKTAQVANKVEARVTESAGKLLGKAAKLATAVGMGAIALPGMALMGSIARGIDFVTDAIGLNEQPKGLKETAGSLGKMGLLGYGYVTGAIEAGGGLVSGVAGGLATAGGIATGVTGVVEGAKGFVDGIKGSYKLAGEIMADK